MDRFLERAPYFLGVMLGGAVTTIEVTLGALVLAIVLGLVLALLRLAGGPASKLALAYIEFLRGTPVLATLFILYFGLVEVGMLTLEPLQAAILGLAMNGSAYLAEVFRAGIQSIHRGQVEAALSIGLTPLGAMRRVVFPQAMRVVLPPVGNFSIGLLKDTAVVSAVAAPEVMFRARQLTTETFQSGQIYVLAALIYLAMSLPLSFFVRRLERHHGRWH